MPDPITVTLTATFSILPGDLENYPDDPSNQQSWREQYIRDNAGIVLSNNFVHMVDTGVTMNGSVTGPNGGTTYFSDAD